MNQIVVNRAIGDWAAEVLSGPYVDLYEEIHAEPPYLSGPLYARERFIHRTAGQVRREGFTLVSAHDGPALAGFAFGLPFPAGRWWGGDASPGPANVVAAEKFAVIELGVHAAYRGRGIGRRLLEDLLTDRAAPYAVLLAHPDAPAHAMYRRWGWQVVGTVRPAPDSGTSDALVLKTPPPA
ncbi:GNAT family N-acetyltransferase [Streptosporangium sp. NPDC006007]|uniref:GNAT family N-acetyltransferase n=1 Tax=Streptosporangium sp. NPDC006007 TaxID=3154575 RepID=UPI0033A7880A